MKVLVTGSNGFLGVTLSRHLEASGFEVTKSNSSICDLKASSSLKIYDHIRFDRIYHLAAWTQAGDFCLYHPGEQWIIHQKID